MKREQPRQAPSRGLAFGPGLGALAVLLTLADGEPNDLVRWVMVALVVIGLGLSVVLVVLLWPRRRS